MYGFDAYGADIDARDVEAYAVFIALAQGQAAEAPG